MRGPQRIVLGTRGSELARAQARLVEYELRKKWPELLVETKIIQTTGDQSGDQGGATVPVANSEQSQAGRLRHYAGAGRKGIFTREIEEALRRGEIDVAVHSAKDWPSESPDDLEICATLPRAAIADALILKGARNLESLPHNAVIATGSVRRQHQLRWKRPDLCFVDLRGNVPTRLRKFIESDWDAIVLARAGLERLGYDLSNHAFGFEGRSLRFELLLPSEFLPAGGQGVIALQARKDAEVLKEMVCAVNDSTTLLALRAEREFLRLLQADCNSPVGVLATIESELMTLRAQVFEPPFLEPKSGAVQSSLQADEPSMVAAALHSLMYDQR